MRPWLLFALLLVLTFGVLQALRDGRLELPRQWNPWAPLVIADPPNLLTRFKLLRLSNNDELCQSVLSEADMRYRPLPDRRTGEGCGFDNAVLIEATSAQLPHPFSLSCRAAVSLASWERHVLQPAAQTYFGVGVRQIDHFGSYACRNVYGREGGRRSQHATADALDVAGFVLEDGQSLRIAQHWRPEGTPDTKAEFLRAVHQGACRFFSAVLGPDYNAAHRDHLHLDRGSFMVCR